MMKVKNIIILFLIGAIITKLDSFSYLVNINPRVLTRANTYSLGNGLEIIALIFAIMKIHSYTKYQNFLDS
jgi:hypothetical protein